MKYTNKFNYPDYVVEWLEKDDYDHDQNSLSATQLLKPTRALILANRHSEELEIDYSDLVSARYGTAIHDSVEKVGLKGCKQEQRLKTTVINKTITGKFDILRELDNNKWELIDVKSTSVWTYIYNSNIEDYKKQLSIYRFLAERNNYEVISTAKVWYVFTDWSSSKARADDNYPPSRIAVEEIKLLSTEQTLQLIGSRIRKLNDLQTVPDEQLPFCTDEELWSSPTKWAVMKKNRKTAIKLYEDPAEAEDHVSRDKDLYISERTGKVRRCNYCAARKVCNQYWLLLAEGRVDE